MPRTVLTGTGVGSRSVVAPCVRFEMPSLDGEVYWDVDTATATSRILDALQHVATRLEQASQQAVSPAAADVLAATAEIAQDPELTERLSDAATTHTPVAAVREVFDVYEAEFAQLGDYMAARIPDLLSVRDRVIARLLDVAEPGLPTLNQPSVVVATDLTPADTSNMDMSQIAGIVTEKGGSTSHTAIIARQLGIACVVGTAGATNIEPGTILAVEGIPGTVTCNPDASHQERISRHQARQTALEQDKQPGATSDGHSIALLGNVGGVDDTGAVLAAGGEGIGLFRTEFLFLNSENEPTIEQQAALYAKVFRPMAGKKVVVRTLDAGSDKPISYATPTNEPNPALGVRAYRLTRSNPGLLERQLEAIRLAAKQHPDTEVWVMAPMISTVAETRAFVNLAHDAGLPQAGVMVEVPSAALLANEILSIADFVSLGTNDLAQYTMASDRLAAELSDLLNPWQSAVLRLIQLVCHAGNQLDKPVGVCGESAADPIMALTLVGLGVSSLSMSASSLAEVRHAIRHTPHATCIDIAHAAVAAPSAKAARNAALELVDPSVRELVVG